MSDKDVASVKRIAVIGGGWSGLYALKTFLEFGHEVVCFEKSGDIGGVWEYQEDPEGEENNCSSSDPETMESRRQRAFVRQQRPGRMARNTVTTISKCYLHASDFPLPDFPSYFPDRQLLFDYLHQYAEHFNLFPHIKLGHCVEAIKKVDGQWLVQVEPAGSTSSEKFYFDVVAVCTGQLNEIHYPVEEENFKNFTGHTMHSIEFQHADVEAIRGKRVLVVGGGESASDIAAEICDVAQKTYVSIRDGAWFQDRAFGASGPVDMCYTKHVRMIGRTNRQSWLLWGARYMALELMWGKGGSGVKIWQPKANYLDAPMNVSRDVIDRIGLDKLEPKGRVLKTEGKRVWFPREYTGRLLSKEEEQEEETSGGSVEVDTIIFATGYKDTLPLVIDTNNNNNTISDEIHPKNCYQLMFYPSDPTLCFIGFARPVLGSVSALAELQARWAAHVYSFPSTHKLPSEKEMCAHVEQRHAQLPSLYPTHHAKLPCLVSHWGYADEIAKQFGSKFKQGKWLRRNPLKWWTIVCAPWSSFIYRLEDKNKAVSDLAYERIKATWPQYHFQFTAVKNTMLFIDAAALFGFLLILATIFYFLYSLF